jgi:tRNA acetyltransferase TAN1
MLTELKETQKYMTRYISRFLPVEKSCNAHIADIEVAAKALFEPHFTQKDSEGNLISRKVWQYSNIYSRKKKSANSF